VNVPQGDKEVQMNKLYRSRRNKMLAGVCGGLADYFQVDPVLVRIIWVILFFASGGTAVLAYIVALIIIPEEPIAEAAAQDAPVEAPAHRPPQGVSRASTGGLIAGFVLITLGAIFLLDELPFTHYIFHNFWHLSWKFMWPGILILIGVVLILRGSKK